MIKERAMELVAALRSGKYKQATNALRKGDSYCCLGVACEISGIGPWKFPTENDDDFYYQGERGVLPESVRVHFGMFSTQGMPNPSAPTEIFNNTKALTTMNDSGLSFAQIADHIEKNWEYL